MGTDAEFARATIEHTRAAAETEAEAAWVVISSCHHVEEIKRILFELGWTVNLILFGGG